MKKVSSWLVIGVVFLFASSLYGFELAVNGTHNNCETARTAIRNAANASCKKRGYSDYGVTNNRCKLWDTRSCYCKRFSYVDDEFTLQPTTKYWKRNVTGIFGKRTVGHYYEPYQSMVPMIYKVRRVYDKCYWCVDVYCKGKRK